MFWDKGPSALKAFIQTHSCNSLCNYLELDTLTNFDVDEIVEKAEQVRKEEDEARMKAAERTQPSEENSGSGHVSRAASVEHN